MIVAILNTTDSTGQDAPAFVSVAPTRDEAVKKLRADFFEYFDNQGDSPETEWSLILQEEQDEPDERVSDYCLHIFEA